MIDPEQQGEDAKLDASLDKPVRGLTERGSIAVEQSIERVLGKLGLNNEDLSLEEQSKKVSTGRIS